jgi:putative oxidoreductase
VGHHFLYFAGNSKNKSLQLKKGRKLILNIMNKLPIIGRILFAIPFGLLGLNHFIMQDFYEGMLTSFIPGGGYTILLIGVLLIAVCISIILNRYVRIACAVIAFLLLMFILTIHIPQLFDIETRETAFVELMKDCSLLGGCLIIMGIYKSESQTKSEEIEDEADESIE